MTRNFNFVTVSKLVQISASPSGWETYYVVFLSAAVALGIPLVLSLVSSIFRKRTGPDKNLPPAADFSGSEAPLAPIEADHELGESLETTLGRRINTRFFLSANAALVLVALTLVLVPYASILRGGTDSTRELLARGLVSVVSLAVFAGLGLLYSARKGDLDWLQSFRGQDPQDRRSGGSE